MTHQWLSPRNTNNRGLPDFSWLWPNRARFQSMAELIKGWANWRWHYTCTVFSHLLRPLLIKTKRPWDLSTLLWIFQSYIFCLGMPLCLCLCGHFCIEFFCLGMALHCHDLKAFLQSKEVCTLEKHDYGSGYAENAVYKLTIRITHLLPFKQITALSIPG